MRRSELPGSLKYIERYRATRMGSPVSACHPRCQDPGSHAGSTACGPARGEEDS